MPARSALLLAAVGALLAGCGTPPSASEEPVSGDLSAIARPSPTPAQTGPAAQTEAPKPVRGDPPPIGLELIAGGLESAISVAGAPEGWLLVNERGGRVVAVNSTDGRAAVALDLTDRVLGGGERGLLGLALHPEWPAVARAFVHYSGLPGGDTVVSEIAGTPGSAETPPTLDTASEQILLQVNQPFSNHNGGQLAFGPDGYLYLGLGDGGAGGDPLGNGQNPASLLGDILRLDVASSGTYAVPPDNPFADGQGGAREVFLSGLRNPWRFSFDPATGLLWIADVGQDAFEEIDRIDPTTQAGANLGWNLMEASHCYLDADCSSEGLILPLAEYGRELGCSVSGGHVYRGQAIPDLVGWYLFGDFCSGLIFALASDAPASDGTLAPHIVAESGVSISTFGEGTDGELYVADIAGGALYRIVAAP